MSNPHSILKRVLLAGGLALGVLATAAFGGPTVGADAPKPTPSRTPTPPPANSGIIPPDLANRRISVGAVQVVGTEATLAFFTAQPTTATVAYKPASGAGAGGQSPAQGYANDHQRTLTGLQANTQYDVTITARTQSGETLSAQTSFTTAPLVLGLTVQALGTEATVRFTTAESASATVAYQPTGGAGGGGQAQSSYGTTHEVKLTGLTSNTQYEVTVTAETTGRKYTSQTRFTTSKQRVRVTLREINVTKDGDWFGDGDPTWFLRLEWAGGQTGGCYPNNGNICETGSHGEGRFVPKNYLGQPLMWLFAEENFDTMPTTFKLSAAAQEYDIIPILPNALNCINLSGACSYDTDLSYYTSTWRVPAGQDWASTPVSLYAHDGGKGFDSTMVFTFELFHDNLSYPSARNMPQSTWAQ